MLCNLCNKNQATVHLTEIVDEQMTELHLCEDCARKKSIQMEQQFGLSDLLAGLVDYGKGLASPEKDSPVSQCPACSLTYEDFRKIGRLGCSECYAAFSKYLGPLLKRIHGANQHMGKAPVALAQESAKLVKSRSADIADLKVRLQNAIEHEEFEEAARLRDAIKETETQAEKGRDEKKKRGGGKKP